MSSIIACREGCQRSILFALGCAFHLAIAASLQAQEVVKVYDQVFDFSLASSHFMPIKTNTPLGQSFTPQLPAIDFVELWVYQNKFEPPPGEQTLTVALRVEGGTPPYCFGTRASAPFDLTRGHRAVRSGHSWRFGSWSAWRFSPVGWAFLEPGWRLD